MSDSVDGTVVADREIVTTRVFDAPRDQVFKAPDDLDKIKGFAVEGNKQNFDKLGNLLKGL